jgi:hypothetical protein
MADTGHAGAAVNALDRIDKQLFGLSKAGFIFFGVDAIDWTGVYTGGVLGADTGFCDHVSHRAVLREGIFSTLIVAQETASGRQRPVSLFCYAGRVEKQEVGNTTSGASMLFARVPWRHNYF